MSAPAVAQRIEPQFLGKVWGSDHTTPWFEARRDLEGHPLGEVWFTAHDLLIKFLFTSQKLSVQVHPDDDYARSHHNSLGKTEMWHVLRAEPGAAIALGFKQPISPDRLLSSAESGAIVDLLNWVEVHPGETYFVPAGTVHAIGPGLALCEIQQNSDLTYRLYDYGRGRELHLKHARDVANLGCHPARSVARDVGDGVQLLVECPYFHTYHTVVRGPFTPATEIHTRFLVVLEGNGQVNGLPASPGTVFEAGSCEWFVEPIIESGPLALLLVS